MNSTTGQRVIAVDLFTILLDGADSGEEFAVEKRDVIQSRPKQ
jgi:hypothetical protein